MPIARDVLTSTTAELPGWKIQSHLGVVTAHVVAGANLFSDVAASFFDIFGGRSKSYQKQLASINEEALSRLRQKAANRGANGLLGVHIDHDEISGQGKSMFMVKVSGTAVLAEEIEAGKRSSKVASNGNLSANEMEVRRRKKQIMNDMTFNLGERSDFEFATQHRMAEYAPIMKAALKQYFTNKHEFTSQAGQKIEQEAKNYYLALDPADASDAIYRLVEGPGEQIWNFARRVVRKGRLLHLGRTKELLRSEDVAIRQRALSLLLEEKRSYNAGDLEDLKQLRELVENAFPTAQTKQVTQQGMLGESTQEVWECQACREEVPGKKMHCIGCRRDRRGLAGGGTQPEEATKAIRERQEVLEDVSGGE